MLYDNICHLASQTVRIVEVESWTWLSFCRRSGCIQSGFKGTQNCTAPVLNPTSSRIHITTSSDLVVKFGGPDATIRG